MKHTSGYTPETTENSNLQPSTTSSVESTAPSSHNNQQLVGHLTVMSSTQVFGVEMTFFSGIEQHYQHVEHGLKKNLPLHHTGRNLSKLPPPEYRLSSEPHLPFPPKYTLPDIPKTPLKQRPPITRQQSPAHFTFASQTPINSADESSSDQSDFSTCDELMSPFPRKMELSTPDPSTSPPLTMATLTVNSSPYSTSSSPRQTGIELPTPTLTPRILSLPDECLTPARQTLELLTPCSTTHTPKTPAGICTSGAFITPRSSKFEATAMSNLTPKQKPVSSFTPPTLHQQSVNPPGEINPNTDATLNKCSSPGVSPGEELASTLNSTSEQISNEVPRPVFPTRTLSSSSSAKFLENTPLPPTGKKERDIPSPPRKSSGPNPKASRRLFQPPSARVLNRDYSPTFINRLEAACALKLEVARKLKLDPICKRKLILGGEEEENNDPNMNAENLNPVTEANIAEIYKQYYTTRTQQLSYSPDGNKRHKTLAVSPTQLPRDLVLAPLQISNSQVVPFSENTIPKLNTTHNSATQELLTNLTTTEYLEPGFASSMGGSNPPLKLSTSR